MIENQDNLGLEDDDLEWETLSEPNSPRRQLTPAQKAYLERKKDRPKPGNSDLSWWDLYKPLDD